MLLYSRPKQITVVFKDSFNHLKRNLHPEIKEKLWGGEFWTKSFYVNTVAHYIDEDTIQKILLKRSKFAIGC
ncbi:transposase [Prolixibacter sp. NT017]|uniref:transposase n=1 Tax=Prolixibacter sp. NT017 TaxID=2652390 RepID=UPI0035A3B4AC